MKKPIEPKIKDFKKSYPSGDGRGDILTFDSDGYTVALEKYIKEYKKWADNGLTNCVDDVIKLKQRIKELEGRVLEYEKEASIRAVIDAESLGGIQQQEGKA